MTAPETPPLGAGVLAYIRREVNARPFCADELSAYAAEIEQLMAENARRAFALAFAMSAIKSGEPWTETCESTIGGALRGDK